MKITVGTTSQSLDSILSEPQHNVINWINSSSSGYSVLIMNEDMANTLYIELWDDATTSDSVPLKPWVSRTLTVDNLSLINLVSTLSISDCFISIH